MKYLTYPSYNNLHLHNVVSSIIILRTHAALWIYQNLPLRYFYICNLRLLYLPKLDFTKAILFKVHKPIKY